MRVSLGIAVALLIVAGLYADSRRAYSIAFDPADAGPAARVVVRLGRPRTAFLNFLPNHPPLGSVIADTGYAAGGLSPETVARIATGRVSGTLDATPPGRVPGWLREVLNGLRPVPRGIAKALLGDPDGVAALKLAFSDPAARGEILSALAVIGRGGAGEDEILAGALADVAPEVRRRGVAVAAAIARRQAREAEAGRPAREAGTLLAVPEDDPRGDAARGAGRSLGGRARGRASGGGDAAAPGRRRHRHARAPRSGSGAAPPRRGGDGGAGGA